MPELFWFLVGCACTALAFRFWLSRRGARPAPTEPVEPEPLPKRPRPRRIELAETRPLEELSMSLGSELASLATGVEGQAQLLCESLGDSRRLVEHAEELWETVRHLRFFSEKLQASSTIPELELQPTDVGQLLGALVLEIEDYSTVSHQVSLSTAPSLPLAKTNPEALRSAVLFLIECVLELEPAASTLLLQAKAEESDDDAVVVRIDIEADLEDGNEIRVKSPDEILFGFLAGKNLLHAQGASVSLDHSPGLNAIASVRLESTPRASRDTDLPDFDPDRDVTSRPHHFGGVLIMEGNSTIRHMLAKELQKTGRNVIVCADGIAAGSLFDATPERFELLILEQESRRLPGEEVALRAIAGKPDLMVILVAPFPGAPIDPRIARHPHLYVIHKPFGLMELRESLAATLGPGPSPVPAGAALDGPA